MKRILTLVSALVILSALMLTLSGCSVDDGFVKFLQNATDKSASIEEEFANIEIISDTAEITFVPAYECKIEYTTHKRITYSTTVENDTLKIKVEDNRRWFQRIFSFGDSSKLTVYLPAGVYSALTIEQNTGNINVPTYYVFDSVDIDVSTGDTSLCALVIEALKIHATTGDITLENVSCGSLDTKVTTGKTSLSNVNVWGDATVNASTGDTELKNVSCYGNLSTVARTGDLNATGLNGGSLSIERSTGEVSLCNVKCSGSVAVKTGTGKIDARAITCTDMTVAVSSGKASLTSVSCTSFTSTGTTGDIEMTSLIASGKIDIERSTGDVDFSACDAEEIYVTTGTGSVHGTLLTNKIFQVRTGTGKIDVPESWEGGKCKITTTTGSVKISIGQ